VLAVAGVAAVVSAGMAVAGSAAAAPSVAPAGQGAGQSVPHPGSSSELLGLSCPSPGSCWAVGDYINGNGADLNQALHWNGARWSSVSVPSPGGTAARSVLFGVRCTADHQAQRCTAHSNRVTHRPQQLI
jgi:hypothetical protein